MLSFASFSLAYRALNVAPLSRTLPTLVFLPTSMQPSVSLAVLPMWISTPSKHGTLISLGRYPWQKLYCAFLENLGDFTPRVTRYRPMGIAVMPARFFALFALSGRDCFKPLSVSSIVSQNRTPSTNNRPMVYVSRLAILTSSSSITHRFCLPRYLYRHAES